MDLLVNLVWLHVNVKEQFVHLKTWDQFLLSKKVVVYASFLGEGASGQEADEEVGGAGIAAWGSQPSSQETRVVRSGVLVLWRLVFVVCFFVCFMSKSE